MKIYNYIIVVLIIGLSIFLAIQYNSIQDLSAKIDNWNNAITQVTICNDQVIEQISKQASKEDFYLTQLSNSTTLVLTVIGIALVIAGFISYVNINERFKTIEANLLTSQNRVDSSYRAFHLSIENLVEEYKKNAEDYKKDSEKIGHDLLKLKYLLDFELSVIYIERGRDKILKDYGMATYLLLVGLKHHVKYLLFKNSVNPNDKIKDDVVFNTIKIIKDRIITTKEFKENGKINISIKTSSDIISLIDSINKINNPRIYAELSQLYNMLEFSDPKKIPQQSKDNPSL